MRIAVISSRQCRGGAAAAADRLCRGLLARGHELWRFVEMLDDGGVPAIHYTPPGWFGRKRTQARALFGISPKRDEGRARCGGNLRKLLAQARPDVINVHGFNQWSKPGLDRETVAEFAAIAPVVWTLHDMWPLNGALDYTGPEIGTADSPVDQAEHDRLLACGSRLAFASPSAWLRRKAAGIFGGGIGVEVLANGVDTDRFRPMPRDAARDVLGVPDDGVLLLAAAERLDAPRKGMDLLFGAMAHLEPRYRLLLAGDTTNMGSLPERVESLGMLNDDRLMRAAYTAADVTVVPSRLDNLPNILIESLACGTPCVGFATGGLGDVIRPGVTGDLARPFDMRDLAAKIDSVAGHPAMKATCREVAVAEYSLDAVARRYLDMFGRMISGRQS